ncbi:transcriptional coactivator p15/PC4 family protein [Thermodesulfobacteriota bacterium]
MEKIVGSLSEYKNRARIDIRVHFQPNQADPYSWVPTKKGIALNPDTWKDFKELIGKVNKAIEKAA